MLRLVRRFDHVKITDEIQKGTIRCDFVLRGSFWSRNKREFLIDRGTEFPESTGYHRQGSTIGQTLRQRWRPSWQSLGSQGHPTRCFVWDGVISDDSYLISFEIIQKRFEIQRQAVTHLDGVERKRKIGMSVPRSCFLSLYFNGGNRSADDCSLDVFARCMLLL